MAITVKHSKVSAIPDGDDTSVVRPSDWNADHTLVGLGTMAEQNANAVAITGGTITNVEITSPELNQINDTNGNEILGFSPTTSATDYLVVKNGIGVGVPLHVYADGSSSNIGLHIQPKGTGLVTISDGTDFNKGIRFRSSSSAASAITLLDAVSSAGRVVTLPDATTTLVGRNTTDTLTNKTLTSPVISGGTIDNASIGATTPSTGNFTTITGQTEVLKGTGQNLFLQSNTFNTTWSLQATSVTGSQSDPFSGSTAWLFAGDGTTSSHGLGQSIIYVNGLTYTYSIYLKKGTNNFAQIRFASGAGGAYANFDLNAGTVGTVGQASGNTPTSTITSIGSGWYRCSMTVAVNASVTTTANIYLVSSSSATAAESNTLATNIVIYGAQLEIGSTLNTYIPTTTTAIYGTPSLSFSGVAGLGLESNGALYVSPAGTGALQAQATTSSTVGGNARGANAVDWQTLRALSTAVASGAYSTVAGGYNNISSGTASFVAGYGNTSSNFTSFVGGGQANTATQQGASVVGGYTNSATGFWNFIGGGSNNSGTANAAVTTQATTAVTSGSTAVTLSASNANIKVGQMITGTGMVNFTYVAAISGTALTLSQNANATGTPTLSFFTPHGVVVGGGNNQATGSYSFIGGGGDAGTAANRNVASGDWSTVCGGWRNTASGTGSFVGGGGYSSTGAYANTASGSNSTISGGALNSATAIYATVCGGVSNTASGIGSVIVGGGQATTRGINGMQAFSYATFSTAGDNQLGIYQLSKSTTDATASVMTIGAGAASTTNQVILPNNSAYFFTGSVIAGVTGGGNTKGWTIEGVIKRGANAASTAIVGTATVTSLYADAGAATWAVTATADTTNGGLKITVTGQAATTIRWVAKVETTEMTF